MTHPAVSPVNSWRISAPALLAALLPVAVAAGAGPSSEQVLPKSTVGYASIADLPDFLERWDKTQIGQLFDLPEMEPFLTQLRDDATERDGKIEDRLGVTFEELRDASSGEVAFALTPPAGGDAMAGVVAIADVEGKRAAAEAVLEKIAARLSERGATDVSPPSSAIEVYSVPYDDAEPRTIAYFLAAERFVACNDADLAKRLLDRLEGSAPDGLVQNEVYRATLAKADAATPQMAPTITWWIDPFAYDAASRTLDAVEDPDEDAEPDADEGQAAKDPVAILEREGFDAVKGIGGRVAIAVDGERDFVHATAVYAPPKPGTAGRSAAERYDGAMRALELPNVASMEVEPWAPRGVAGYKSFSVDIQNLFDNVASLVDAFIYKNAFETTLEAFEKDPFGPKINLRDEVVAHLGQRVTSMSDYSTPITVDCERYLTVLQVTDEAALRAPLDKWMESDGAERKTLQTPDGDEIYYWEIVPADDPAELDKLDDGLLPPSDDDLLVERDDEENERVLRRAAVCLYDGELAIGSDVEFLKQALFGVDAAEALAADPELKRVRTQLDRLAAPERSAWSFTRTEKSFRLTYELLRTDKMPEAQTFFARLLNRVLTTADEREAHLVRKQKIDGSELPDYEVVRPFLGPQARAVRSHDDGWVIVGVILRSASPAGDE